MFFRVFWSFVLISLAAISCFGIYAIYAKRNTRALVLGRSGMWIDGYDLIPWSNIATMRSSVNANLPALFITVKDVEVLRAHATRMGRFVLMLASKMGKFAYSPGYHVSVSGLDTPDDVILAFARQYMQSDLQAEATVEPDLQQKMTVYQQISKHKIAVMLETITTAGVALGGLWLMLCLPPVTQWKGGLALSILGLCVIYQRMLFALVTSYEERLPSKVLPFISLAITITTIVLLGLLLLCILFVPQSIAVILFNIIIALFIISFVLRPRGIVSLRNAPVLVLDHAGVLTSHFGFIPWGNIADIGPISPGTASINIRVVDLEALKVQASRLGKINLFMLGFFTRLGHKTYYHISIPYLDTPNDAIIACARQYMQHN
jgi:hypothetical protein